MPASLGMLRSVMYYIVSNYLKIETSKKCRQQDSSRKVDEPGMDPKRH